MISMIIRKYEPSDCKETAELFYHTVHTVNAKDYTKEQLNAWAAVNMDMREWNRTLLEHFSMAAIENNRIVGFGDIDTRGYLDRLYVHKDYQKQGVATAICNELEQFMNRNKIMTQASITAKSFFEQRGYQVVRKQEVMRNGIFLTNYLMEKEMHSP